VDDELITLARWAAQELAERDAYQNRPERGDWGVECACCMGEMFDAEDRAKIARLAERCRARTCPEPIAPVVRRR